MQFPYIFKRFIHSAPTEDANKAPLTRLELLELWLNGFVWSSVIVIIVSLLVLSGWWLLNRSHPKIFSGINYFRFPVTVKISDSTYKLDQFEVFAHQTSKVGDVKVEVFDDSGDLIYAFNQTTTSQSGAMVSLLSAETGVKMCPALVNVTELFYPRLGKEKPEAYLVTNLKSNPQSDLSTYFEYKTLPPFYKLLVPASYDGQDLPGSISENQKIYGVYFVECAHLEDQVKLTEEIIWWTNFDPLVQQQLYQQRQSELDSTPEYQL